MGNNFYLGDVYHCKKFLKQAYIEKLVLYSEDHINYLDLISGIWYCIYDDGNDYVFLESIVPTDVNLYKIDYLYLLSKYKANFSVKIKKHK